MSTPSASVLARKQLRTKIAEAQKRADLGKKKAKEAKVGFQHAKKKFKTAKKAAKKLKKTVKALKSEFAALVPKRIRSKPAAKKPAVRRGEPFVVPDFSTVPVAPEPVAEIPSPAVEHPVSAPTT